MGAEFPGGTSYRVSSSWTLLTTLLLIIASIRQPLAGRGGGGGRSAGGFVLKLSKSSKSSGGTGSVVREARYWSEGGGRALREAPLRCWPRRPSYPQGQHAVTPQSARRCRRLWSGRKYCFVYWFSRNFLNKTIIRPARRNFDRENCFKTLHYAPKIFRYFLHLHSPIIWRKVLVSLTFYRMNFKWKYYVLVLPGPLKNLALRMNIHRPRDHQSFFLRFWII